MTFVRRRDPPRPDARSKIYFRYIDGLDRSPGCYIELGDQSNPPLVFLHGFGGDLLTWQYCLSAFAGRFRVIALDLPGHGRSTADVGDGSLAYMTAWLDDALTALNIPAAHLVGHSMGGKIGISLALTRPERVTSLSLISPAGLGGFFDLELLTRFIDGDATEIAQRLLGPASSILVPSLARALSGTGRTSSQRVAFETLLGDVATIGEAFSNAGVPWQDIACPTHVIWGGADTILPLPAPSRLPPNAAFHALSGIGHLPQLESPRQVITLLDRFLP